ncbi:hypothetical protein ACFB49_42680 [Sphingomonas sp. DBB INV C78]|uniref:hypothetical protein n=1 Tax=Sphingomonas sp. DBB INV C78 TaxID=3349434 RepID=UPI0036D4150D
MTIKSISTILDQLEQAGEIIRFLPPFDPDETEKRVLFVTKKIDGFIKGHSSRRGSKDYYARIRAQLGEFVKGETIRDDEEVLKKMAPYANHVWEMRVTFQPHARIFGAFAGVDTFLAITALFRDDCEKGGFRKATTAVCDQWFDWFGTLPRLPGHPLAFCCSNVRG